MPDDTAVTRAELLAVVERSPEAAGAHDRAGWVGLFTADGVVEDPVGSRPHRGRAALERFYDTFIAPRDITFHRDTDLVVGTTVVRDLELEVRMSAALVLRIRAYLRYDVDTEGDQLKIARLQAHWELPAMVVQFGRSGPAAVPAGLALTRALLANQGASGTAGFLSGFRGVGNRGKRQLTGLLDDAGAGDEVAVRRRFTESALVTLGDGARLVTSELVARLDGTRWMKMISAGDTVAVAVERNGRRSVLIAQLQSRPLAITRLRLFTEE
jgi:SnoaL-like domain